jgi:hypothetical protein
MPDGDRFERVLRGGGWRSAYKIAAGGGTDQRVVEKLGSACLSLINSENSDCARKMVSALDSALSSDAMPLFTAYAHNASFEAFQRNIDDISAEHSYGDFAQLCGRAVGRRFIENEHSTRALRLPGSKPCSLKNLSRKSSIGTFFTRFATESL